MDWKSLGESLAKIGLPLLGMALPIPGGAEIGAALASHIGSPSAAPSDILATITASAEKLQAAREFELTHQEKMLELTLAARRSEIEAEAADRASARQAMVSTKAYTPAVLSWIVVIAIFSLYGWLVIHGNAQDLDDIILGRILGTLDTAFAVVLSFWLGTSFGSRTKDATIQAQTKGAQ